MPQDSTFRAGRRSLFRHAAALAAAGGAGGAANVLAAEANTLTPSPDASLPVPPSMRTPGSPVGARRYGEPSAFEGGVVRNVPPNLPRYISASSRTPLQDLDGIITPNGLFYERHRPTHPPARSGHAPARAARPGQEAAGVYRGRAASLPFREPDPLSRMRRQS